MNINELIEFIAMLLVEKKVKEEPLFYDYFLDHSNRKEFNKKYEKLLDKFLNFYALNKTEKSEKDD